MMRVFELFQNFSMKNHIAMRGKINKRKYLGGCILCEKISYLKEKVGILFQIAHFFFRERDHFVSTGLGELITLVCCTEPHMRKTIF